MTENSAVWFDAIAVGAVPLYIICLSQLMVIPHVVTVSIGVALAPGCRREIRRPNPLRSSTLF